MSIDDFELVFKTGMFRLFVGRALDIITVEWLDRFIISRVEGGFRVEIEVVGNRIYRDYVEADFVDDRQFAFALEDLDADIDGYIISLELECLQRKLGTV